MLSKNRLKELCAYRQQKRQDEECVFIVEGVKMAAEALQWGAEVLCICATTEWQRPAVMPDCECLEVSQAELERLSLMRTPNQVWMLVRRVASGQWPVVSNAAASANHSPLTLALDRLQDPGNMGTIMRTADWYGVRHIVCSRDTVNCYNPKVVQASMGAIFRTKVEYVDLPQWLAECGMPVFGASLQGEPINSLTPLPLLLEREVEMGANHSPRLSGEGSGVRPYLVLLIGNESRGISPEAMAQVTHPVLIPNRGGTAESLNAAVAAAILMDKLIG